MKRLLFAAAALFSVAATGAPAATMLTTSAGAACQGGCVRDYRLTQVFNAGSLRGAGPVDAVQLDRALLGNFRNGMFRLTFWTNDGATQVGDFGSFDLSVLGADIVTLTGKDVAFDASQGELLMRLDFVRPNRGGSGGPPAGAFGLTGAANRSANAALALEEVSQPVVLTPPGADAILLSNGTPLADLVTSVPEPSTWALAIAGFGMTGAVLRRRRQPLQN